MTSLQSSLDLLWTSTRGSPQVCIALLDTCVRLQHDALRNATLDVLIPENFTPSQSTSHGTYLASVLFSPWDSPVKGIAPDCRGLIIPVYEDSVHGLSTSQDILTNAIRLALDAGAHIINISGGGMTQVYPESSSNLEMAAVIRECHDRGVQVIASVGNEGCDCLHVPASLPHVLAVGAVDSNGEPFPFNNYGWAYRWQGILAQLDGVTGPHGMAGTLTERKSSSCAAAVVSGITGLLTSLQVSQGLEPNPVLVGNTLLSTADPCDPVVQNHCERYLAGILNVPQAYASLMQAGTPSSDRQSPGYMPQGPDNITTDFGTQEEKRNTEFTLNSGPDGTKVKRTVTAATAHLTPLHLHDNTLETEHLRDNQFIHQNAHQMEPVNKDHREETIAADTPYTQTGQPEKAPVQRSVQPEAVIQPSDCGCGCQDGSLIYCIGSIGYTFTTRTRRTYFQQQLNGSPEDQNVMLGYLKSNPHDAEGLVWTVNMDNYPVYAIVPDGAYAPEVYRRLIELLGQQLEGQVEKAAIAGRLKEKTVSTENTYPLKPIYPVLSGITGWHVAGVVKNILGKRPPKNSEAHEAFEWKESNLQNFFQRVYHDLQNPGTDPAHRAVNFAATEALRVAAVFETALKSDLALNDIAVSKSMVAPPGSDCWDVKLVFFNPQQRLSEAKKVFRFTVDVSDVIPLITSPVKSWSEY